MENQKVSAVAATLLSTPSQPSQSENEVEEPRPIATAAIKMQNESPSDDVNDTLTNTNPSPA